MNCTELCSKTKHCVYSLDFFLSQLHISLSMIKFHPYKIPEQVEKTEEELTKEEYEGSF